jgi:hypothetical protein
MPLGQVAAARLPDPGDRQPPLSRLLTLTLSFWLRGGGKVGIGGDKDAQSLRWRGEPVHQVVQVVIVVSAVTGNSPCFPAPGGQRPRTADAS